MSKKIFSNYKKYWVTKPIKTIPSSLDFDVDLLGADKNIHVLDIGCGNGNLLMELSKKGFSHLYGVDINLNQPFSLVSNIYLSNQDANHLEFKDEMFDATVMKALLTVVVSDYSIYKSLSEAYRVLKPDGKIIIKDFFQNWHIPIYRDRYLTNMKNRNSSKCIFPVFDKTGLVRYYARHFNTQEISLMLIKIGFRIKKLVFDSVKTQSGNEVIGFTIVALK